MRTLADLRNDTVSDEEDGDVYTETFDQEY